MPVTRSSRRPLRILHTADVHLDNDSFGTVEEGRLQRALYRRSFQGVIDVALDRAVDLLLIAGDLFDHNRVADETVHFVQEQLRRLQRPVVILPGNHDCLYTHAVYDRHDLPAACDGVQVITRVDGQIVELPQLDLVLWGRAMIDHEPGFHPLQNIPTRHDARWHIGMAHGFFYETRQAAERSSPIFGEEIRDTGWDYIAMGHRHVVANVSQGEVAAYYSGAPSIHGRAETPNGHVLLVELCPEKGVTVSPRPVVGVNA